MQIQQKEDECLNSRELVLRTLSFRNTSGRVPRQLWTLPWAQEHHTQALAELERDFPADLAGVNGFLKEKPVTTGSVYEPGLYIDEWGAQFHNLQRGVIGEVKEPLIIGEEWEDADKVHIPVAWLSLDKDRINRDCAASSRFCMAGACPRPFEQLQFLRGTEALFIDLALDNPGLHRFLERMHFFYCQVLEAWANTDVDALSIMDDWGSQRSLLIDPSIWRRVFKPLYKDYINIAHAHGKKMFMHSDGYTLQIIPDLIDLGLDAFNTQIFCIGIDKLTSFRGKITFWGEVDRQHLLVDAPVEAVKQAIQQVDRTLWQNGGCIAQCEFGAGGRPENVRAVFEAWQALHG